MMGKGLSGFSWHIEYKSKGERKFSETCIYLTDERECQNEKSYHYLSKCFSATNCSLKVKPQKPIEKDVKQNKEIDIAKSKDKKTNKNKKSLLISKKCSVTLLCLEKMEKIKLYMNYREFEELPPLHRMCLGKKIGMTVEWSNLTYHILNFKENEMSEYSYEFLEN